MAFLFLIFLFIFAPHLFLFIMSVHIGVLLPRSVEYPSMAFDLLDGLRLNFKRLGLTDYQLYTENIGFGENPEINFAAAEKAAQLVIRETSSYDYWVTKSYILLGDVFLQQKDYFNAKATYESVALNAAITELKNIAQEKLAKAKEEEKLSSKI